MSNAINVGDRVQWTYRWYGQEEDEPMVGTVLEIVFTAFGPHAWVSVKNEQSPLFARLVRLTKVKPEREAVV